MLGLILVLSIGAPAAQIEGRVPAPPAAMTGPAKTPKTLEFPALPAVPPLSVQPELQAPAQAPAAPAQAAAPAVQALGALGARLEEAKTAPSSSPESTGERLERFFDKIDGQDATGDAAPASSPPIDYFPNEKPGLPVPVHHGPLPPPPPIKSVFFRHASRALPAFLVLSHIFVGVEAVSFAARGWVLEAGALVLAAGILTDLAARTARFFRIPADIEGRVDAFAGIASFVLAPAVILYKTALQAVPWAGLAVACFFAGAGIFRIMRGRPEHHGLTVHAAAGAAVAMALASGVLPQLAAAFIAAAATVLGAAMLGARRFPRYRKVSVALALLLGALYASFAAPLAHPGLVAVVPAIGFAAYFGAALLRRGRQAHE